MPQFHDRLKTLREEHHFSQLKLSQELLVSQQTIAKWESGKTTPNPEMIKRISDFFNVTTDYLLGRTDQTKNNDSVSFDDFTYAMHNETGELGDADKEMLLAMARMMKERLDKEKRE